MEETAKGGALQIPLRGLKGELTFQVEKASVTKTQKQERSREHSGP